MNLVEFPVEKLISITSNLIDVMLYRNNKIPNRQNTCFHSKTVPTVSVLAYLRRIHTFTPFSNEVLISVLVYFDRIVSQLNVTINSYNIHRLLITSIMVASKFTSDIYYSNSRYAKVGGISIQELNQLELEFLFLIKFQLHISLNDIQTYANQLLSHAVSFTPNLLDQHPYPLQSNKANNNTCVVSIK